LEQESNTTAFVFSIFTLKILDTNLPIFYASITCKMCPLL